MTRPLQACSAAAALAVLSLTLPARADPPEPAVQVVEGLAANLDYTMHTEGAAIQSLGDLDLFLFDGVAGESVRIVLRSFDDLDLVAELHDPAFDPVDSFGCGVLPSCTSVLDVVLPGTGTYSLLVSDDNGDDLGSYRLQLERFPFLSSPTLLDGVLTSGTLDLTDVDGYTFEGVAGDMVQLTIQAFDGLDPQVTLVDPTGAVEDAASCSGAPGCTSVIARTLARTGTYRVVIHDGSYDEAGAYEITLACVAGTCPPGPVTYCAGKPSSAGCVPFLTTEGRASQSLASPFRLQANYLVPDEAGVFLYGSSKANLSFHGGKLCVKAPFRRWLPAKAVPDPGPAPCTGFFARDFNPRIQSGVDPILTVGATITAQYRQRDPLDPAGFGDSLTDAVQFTVEP